MHTPNLYDAKLGVVPGLTSADRLVDPYSDDLDAVADWLLTKQLGSKHSIRAYRASAFALREWVSARSADVKKDALIRLTPSEAQAYVADLARKKTLKTSSLKHRIVILSNMYEYWSKPRDGGRRIAEMNPFSDLSRTLKSDRTPNIGSQKAFRDQEIEQIRHVIAGMVGGPYSKHFWRTNLIWLLASRLALRREEIANLRAMDFSMSSAVKGRWVLRINGKGRTSTDVPDLVVVPDEVMACIRGYRSELGLFPDPLPSESTPLLRRLSFQTSSRPNEFLTPEHVAKIMKMVFRMAALDASERLQDTALERRLKDASIHWGRHTWFMQSLKKHPIHLVSKGGRHKDIRTTQKSYVSPSEDDLAKLAE